MKIDSGCDKGCLVIQLVCMSGGGGACDTARKGVIMIRRGRGVGRIQ